MALAKFAAARTHRSAVASADYRVFGIAIKRFGNAHLRDLGCDSIDSRLRRRTTAMTAVDLGNLADRNALRSHQPLRTCSHPAFPFVRRGGAESRPVTQPIRRIKNSRKRGSSAAPKRIGGSRSEIVLAVLAGGSASGRCCAPRPPRARPTLRRSRGKTRERTSPRVRWVSAAFLAMNGTSGSS